MKSAMNLNKFHGEQIQTYEQCLLLSIQSSNNYNYYIIILSKQSTCSCYSGLRYARVAHCAIIKSLLDQFLSYFHQQLSQLVLA